jgi:hypothetical protein
MIATTHQAPSTLRRDFSSPSGGGRGGGHPLELVLATITLLYLITASGYVTLADGASMVAVTASLMHGHLDVPAGLGHVGVGGHAYSIYGLGWPLVNLPFYALGSSLQRFLPASGYSMSVAFSSFLNPVLVAGSAYALARFVRHLGGSVRTAVIVAAIFAVATPAWAFTKDAFSEPLVMLSLIAAAYLLRHGGQLTLGTAAAAGGLLGLAVLTRMDALPEVGLVALYGLWPSNRRTSALLWGALLLPLIAGGIVQLVYDQARFGNPFLTGYEYYGAGAGFQRSLGGVLSGLGSILVDPSRGIIWFIPVVIGAVLLWPRFLRRARAEALLAAALFGVAWLEHANLFTGWDAGWTWGPRFMIPVLPFILLPLCTLSPATFVSRLAMPILAVAGVAANIGPVFVNYSRYFYASSAGLSPGRWPQWYLDNAALGVIGNALFGRVPSGRISELAPSGNRAIVEGAASLNAPDFWWFFLVQSHVKTALVLVAVGALMVALLLLAGLTVRACERQRPAWA